MKNKWDINEYSNIFGERKYRAHQILEEFCNKYYNCEVYNVLLEHEHNLKSFLNEYIGEYASFYKSRGTLSIFNDQIAKLAEEYAARYFNVDAEPNGAMQYPDYIINLGSYENVYVDAKCVAYIPRKSNDTDNPVIDYNNGCGQIKEAAENIWKHYNSEHNPFYRSFILYMYYNENGGIEDVIFMPTIYAINLRKYDWNDLSTFMFGVKGATNSNITLSLPSFLKKMGMMDLEEKELALATAAYNYLKLHNYYDEDNTIN